MRSTSQTLASTSPTEARIETGFSLVEAVATLAIVSILASPATHSTCFSTTSP